jgi:hypothetical protein
MFIFGLVFLVVALILIGIGLAIGLVACACAVILLSLGVVSSSFLLGLLSGRAAVGFRVFFLQCGILVGVPAGAVCAWLGKQFSETLSSFPSDWLIMLYGAIGGAFAGACIGFSLDFMARWLVAWAGARASRVPSFASARNFVQGIRFPEAKPQEPTASSPGECPLEK